MNEKTQLLDNIRQSIKKYCETFHDFSFHPEKPAVRLHEPTFGEEEIYAVLETMLSTKVTMIAGTQVKDFERQCATYFGSQYALMNNSGSSANLLAIATLSNPVTPDHLNAGDEVLVPALSWSTTVWPIIQCGLIPVMVDCDPQTLNLDLNKLEAAIGPKTRAIMLVHVYGNPCDMDGIMAVAKKHNLFVIEDCCEAMGAYYDGKAVGTMGHIGTYSFYFCHHITTMEGGLCVTDHFDLIETMRILRAHGWSREGDRHAEYAARYPHIDPRFIFVNVGYNMRPMEVQAAMGRVQLPKLAAFNDIRRAVAAEYIEAFSAYDDVLQWQHANPRGEHVWFGFPLIVKKEAPFTMKEITTYLQQHGVETRPVIAGNIARHPAFEMFPCRIAGDLSCADAVMQRGFAIADHHAVDANARRHVIETVHTFMRNIKASQSKKSMMTEEVV